MAIQLTYQEKDVEDLLEKHCPKYIGCRFSKRQVRTPVGVIDVVAQSLANREIYYVIEIKNAPLDAAAYVQVLRYSHWLNSERARGGRRVFIPVLIGSTLREELAALCEYFDPMRSSWPELYGKVFYRVFNFDPLIGVRFDWVNSSQRQHSDSLINRYHHAADLTRALEIDKLRLEIEIERLRSEFPGLRKPAAITLVKSSGDAA